MASYLDSPQIALALSDALESNSAGAGVLYTSYEYCYGLAIADALHGKSQNLAAYSPFHWQLAVAIAEALSGKATGLGATYSDFEYRHGLAIADAVKGKPLNFAVYSEAEIQFARAIAPVLVKFILAGDTRAVAQAISSSVADSGTSTAIAISTVDAAISSSAAASGTGSTIAQSKVSAASSPSTASSLNSSDGAIKASRLSAGAIARTSASTGTARTVARYSTSTAASPSSASSGTASEKPARTILSSSLG